VRLTQNRPDGVPDIGSNIERRRDNPDAHDPSPPKKGAGRCPTPLLQWKG
jgi:hypothetical protein